MTDTSRDAMQLAYQLKEPAVWNIVREICEDDNQIQQIECDHDARALIEGFRARLNPREVLVLKLRFGIGGGEELTSAEVGSVLGVCAVRAQQIQASALRKMRWWATFTEDGRRIMAAAMSSGVLSR